MAFSHCLIGVRSAFPWQQNRFMIALWWNYYPATAQVKLNWGARNSTPIKAGVHPPDR
jgi:hypothetical protein